MLALLSAGGCAAIPEVTHEPRFHNPFPQLHRVAVLPFFNQSGDPTLNQDDVALAYYNELQLIRGFEVMPVGVVKQRLLANQVDLNRSTDYQAIARMLDVDAVVVGAITDYTAYYPPRLTMAVNWYAANPGFHPIPPGYGLPWGTPEEEYIPDSLVFEAEFALAREQLATQTPTQPLPSTIPQCDVRPTSPIATAAGTDVISSTDAMHPAGGDELPSQFVHATGDVGATASDVPLNWPDPSGFVPPPPAPVRPLPAPHHGPIMTHVRTYNGHDSDFTTALASYYYFRDDARFGGWQSYLERSDDFIRFCCYLHLTEMLSARGGVGKTQVAWRWPIGR
jgi:hypothetical protein